LQIHIVAEMNGDSAQELEWMPSWEDPQLYFSRTLKRLMLAADMYDRENSGRGPNGFCLWRNELRAPPRPGRIGQSGTNWLLDDKTKDGAWPAGCEDDNFFSAGEFEESPPPHATNAQTQLTGSADQDAG
jgi:hypothetical protein